MFVKSLANKYLGCSQFLTLMNKASMNIIVQGFLMNECFHISLITVKMLGGIIGTHLKILLNSFPKFPNALSFCILTYNV